MWLFQMKYLNLCVFVKKISPLLKINSNAAKEKAFIRTYDAWERVRYQVQDKEFLNKSKYGYVNKN